MFCGQFRISLKAITADSPGAMAVTRQDNKDSGLRLQTFSRMATELSCHFLHRSCSDGGGYDLESDR